MAVVFKEDQIVSRGSISHAQFESRACEVSREQLQQIGRSIHVRQSVTRGGHTSKSRCHHYCQCLLLRGYFLFFIRLCASLMSRLILDIMLLQRLDVFGIILVLIYSLYQKKYNSSSVLIVL
jgi:hypothetical protein